MRWLGSELRTRELRTLMQQSRSWLWALFTLAGAGALLLGAELVTFLVLSQVLLGEDIANLTGGATLEGFLGGYTQVELLILSSSVFAGIVLLRPVVIFLYQYFTYKWVKEAIIRLQKEVMESIVASPTSLFDKRSPGDILHGVMEAPLGVMWAIEGTSGLIASIFQILLTIIVIAYVSPWLPLIAIGVLVPTVFFVSRPLQGRTERTKRRHMAERIDATQLATIVLGGIRDIKALSRESQMVDLFTEHITRAEDSGIRLQTMAAIPGPLMQAVFQFTFALAIIIMAIVTPPENLVSYLPYAAVLGYSLMRVYPSVSRVVRSRLRLSVALPNLEISREWSSLPDDVLAGGTHAASAQFEAIRFDNVSFAYDTNKPALIGLNFAIEAGKITSFVGESGSGKSTIIDLILKFRSPESGAVFIGDQDLSDVARPSWLQQVGIVRQNVFFFSGTIRDNLLAWKPDASEEELVSVCAQAGALDFISDMADGFDSVVGDRGVTMSGGQLQRIALARALLRDPQVLILDESLSALDGETETKVLEPLLTNSAKRTIILVSHRLTTIENANHIIVLDHGRVVEQGSHTELLDKRGRYTELFATQIGLSGIETGSGGKKHTSHE